MHRSAVRMLTRLGGVLLAGLVVAVVTPAARAFAVPHPPPPAGTVTTQGLYHTTSSYTGDLNAVKAWQISWTVPQFTNGDAAWGAVGQWFSNIEGGVYYTPSEGWWVYYYGDDDGLADNNPECGVSWDTGGHCHGAMEHLVPGHKVTFVYQYCAADHTFDAAGARICLFVNMNDGVGDRFLMTDAPRPEPEMYAHDIETFGDSGITEPIVSCTQPTRMQGQRIRVNNGDWSALTGTRWNFNDDNPNYEFRGVKFSASPATWLTCSPTTNGCPDPVWSSITTYTSGQQVYWNQHKWSARNTSTGRVPAGGSSAWRDLGGC